MKALTIKQPYANMIFKLDAFCVPFKRVETRSWKTSYRGKLAIHAAKKHDEGMLLLMGDDELDTFACAGIISEEDIVAMPHGEIIGEVTLVDCIPIETLRKSEYCTVFEEIFGDWNDGRYGWIFADPIRYENPIPAVGRLGLWEWNATQI